MDLINTHALANAALFSTLGLLFFVAALRIFDWITPGNFWRELLDEQNTALAIVVGSVALGISMIVAAAIHG